MADISVVIPVYNVEQYLDECIRSVVQQTLKTIEVIIVDDGSRDGSAELCDAWAAKDNRITVIHQQNGGLSHARNTGLYKASGELVYFLDSDDYIEPDMLEMLYKIVIMRGVQVCCFDGVVFTDDVTASDQSLECSYDIRSHVYPAVMTGAQALDLFTKHNEFRPAVQYMVFNRLFLLENALQFRDKMIHEDELFTLQAFDKATAVAHVPFHFYHRRIRQGSIMAAGKTSKNFAGYYQSFRWLYDGCAAGTLAFGETLCQSNLIRLAICMAETYSGMQTAERRKAAAMQKQADSDLKASRYFQNLRLRVLWELKATAAPLRWLKSLYRLLKTGMPGALKRALKTALRPGGYTRPKHVIRDELGMGKAPKIVLLCTPAHGNLGDQAIAAFSRQWLTKQCPYLPVKEITITQYEQDPRIVERYIHGDDVLVVCGGGWLGNLWLHNEVTVRRIIRKFRKNRIIILPQTIYFTDDASGRAQKNISQAVYHAHPDLWICLREAASHRFMVENRFLQNADRALCLPDMALGFQNQEGKKQRKGIAFCIRADKESVLSNAGFRALYAGAMALSAQAPDLLSTLTGYPITEKTRSDELQKFWDVLAGKRLVVTDRLHCMVFCAITATPCIAFDNLSQKVSGVFAWISDLPYVKLAHSPEEAREYMQALLTKQEEYRYTCDFSAAYQRVIDLITKRG